MNAKAPDKLLFSGALQWRLPESNWGHTDFQSVALPAELKRRQTCIQIIHFMAKSQGKRTTGLSPALTHKKSNYAPMA